MFLLLLSYVSGIDPVLGQAAATLGAGPWRQFRHVYWPLLLPEQRLRADAEHRFKQELVNLGPVSHVRMNIHPDGGVSRLRLYGEAVRA